MYSDVLFVPGTMSQFSSALAKRARQTDFPRWPIHVTSLEEWYSEHLSLYLKGGHGSLDRWRNLFDLSKRTVVHESVVRQRDRQQGQDGIYI
jgi:hypothetical protein